MSCILVRRYLGSTKYWSLPTGQQDVRYTLLIFTAMETEVSECKKVPKELTCWTKPERNGHYMVSVYVHTDIFRSLQNDAA